MVDKARRIDRRQICGEASLRPILFLGYIPPVNVMEEVGSPRAGSLSFPLELVRCESCTLVQIDVEVAPELLFPRSYPYRTGTTGALRRNFREQAEEARRVVGLQERALVVDIGSNDGTLLANYLESGCRYSGRAFGCRTRLQSAWDRDRPGLFRQGRGQEADAGTRAREAGDRMQRVRSCR